MDTGDVTEEVLRIIADMLPGCPFVKLPISTIIYRVRNRANGESDDDDDGMADLFQELTTNDQRDQRGDSRKRMHNEEGDANERERKRQHVDDETRRRKELAPDVDMLERNWFSITPYLMSSIVEWRVAQGIINHDNVDDMYIEEFTTTEIIELVWLNEANDEKAVATKLGLGLTNYGQDDIRVDDYDDIALLRAFCKFGLQGWASNKHSQKYLHCFNTQYIICSEDRMRKRSYYPIFELWNRLYPLENGSWTNKRLLDKIHSEPTLTRF